MIKFLKRFFTKKKKKEDSFGVTKQEATQTEKTIVEDKNLYEQVNWSLMDLEDTDRINHIKALMSEVKDGDKFIGGSLSQFKPNTELFKGIKNLAFIDVNTVNCKLPEDAKTSRTNTTINEYEVAEEEVAPSNNINDVLKGAGKKRKPIIFKKLKFKKTIGKRNPKKMTDKERKNFFKNNKFKNKTILKNFGSEIKEAK